MADEVAPADLARLWRVPAPGRLGRPAGLDVERVVRTAVELADREGLAAVTLPEVASTLGVTKMALYRYVGSKDELYELMTDLALGPAPEVSAEWRAGVRQWAHALRAVYTQHPWLPQLPVTGPPRGPNGIDWMDTALQACVATGLNWATKVGILMLVSAHVRQSDLITQQLTAARRGTGLDDGQAIQVYGRTLAELVDPARYPQAAQLFAAPLFYSTPAESADNDFVFGLELILNGVAAEL